MIRALCWLGIHWRGKRYSGPFVSVYETKRCHVCGRWVDGWLVHDESTKKE